MLYNTSNINHGEQRAYKRRYDRLGYTHSNTSVANQVTDRTAVIGKAKGKAMHVSQKAFPCYILEVYVNI